MFLDIENFLPRLTREDVDPEEFRELFDHALIAIIFRHVLLIIVEDNHAMILNKSVDLFCTFTVSLVVAANVA